MLTRKFVRVFEAIRARERKLSLQVLGWLVGRQSWTGIGGGEGQVTWDWLPLVLNIDGEVNTVHQLPSAEQEALPGQLGP